MNLNGRVLASQETPHAHDGPAGSNSGDKSVRFQPGLRQLRPDFRTRGGFMGLDVGLIRELVRKKHALGIGAGKFFGHADTAQEPTLFGSDQDNVSAIAPDEISSFL